MSLKGKYFYFFHMIKNSVLRKISTDVQINACVQYFGSKTGSFNAAEFEQSCGVGKLYMGGKFLAVVEISLRV